MKTEILLVEERALRCVAVERTSSVEVPIGYRDPQYLATLIARGKRNVGPLGSYFARISGTEKIVPLGLHVLGTAGGPADIPLAKESEVGE
jgi:hypothetical protein